MTKGRYDETIKGIVTNASACCPFLSSLQRQVYNFFINFVADSNRVLEDVCTSHNYTGYNLSVLHL